MKNNEKLLELMTQLEENEFAEAGINVNPETAGAGEVITPTNIQKVYGFEYPNGEKCTIRFSVSGVKELSNLRRHVEGFKDGEIDASVIARYVVKAHNCKNPILLHTIGEGGDTINEFAESFGMFERYDFITNVGAALSHFFLFCRAKG